MRIQILQMEIFKHVSHRKKANHLNHHKYKIVQASLQHKHKHHHLLLNHIKLTFNSSSLNNKTSLNNKVSQENLANNHLNN